MSVSTYNKKHRSLMIPFLVWGSAMLFFSFQFAVRISIGILKEDILSKYQINASEFGSLAGYYYLGYAGMQIPIGIMLDRFNLRTVTSASIMVTALGTMLFTIADSWVLLLLGRFTIGVGSAVGFLGVVKVIKSYFPDDKQQTIMGLSFTFGLVGAIGGGVPLRLACNYLGYTPTLYFLTILCVCIGVINFACHTYARKYPCYENSDQIQSSGVLKLLLNPIIILAGICGGLMVGTLEGFADVWSIQFFTNVYHFSNSNSIFLGTSIVFIGMGFGAPVLSYISNKFGSINMIIFITGTLISVIFLLLFFYLNIPYYALVILMFILGILCSYQILVFNLVSTLVSSKDIGVSIALINCINMSFGHFFHKTIGALIEHSTLYYPLVEGQYSINNFVWGLSIIPICCTIGQFGFLYLEYTMKRRLRNKVIAKA